VYGNCDGALVPETRPVAPATDRARRRLDAETTLRAWGRRNHVSVTVLRVPGIYSRDRLPLERLRARTPVLRNDDDVYTNHIHADDLADIALAALERGRAGRIYNVADRSNLKMGEYFDLVARAFSLPAPPRISRAEAHQHLSRTLLSFMSESRRLRTDRMLRELEIRLSYPSVQSALGEWRTSD
jgi:nucleoside-diphosphate-sugar epimerase